MIPLAGIVAHQHHQLQGTQLKIVIKLAGISQYNIHIYLEYWELGNMYRLAQIYEEAKYDLHDLLRLHRIAKLLGLEKHNIISAFELIKHDQLETLQWKVGYLRSEINMLEWEKRNSRN